MNSQHLSVSGLAGIEFATNPEPRCACLVLADTSGSMDGDPIAQLSAGLDGLKNNLIADPLACLRVELALVTFNASVRTEVDFCSPANFLPSPLRATGGTALGAGLIRALDMLEARRVSYRAAGLPYYRPWLVLITDAMATDDVTEAARRVKEAESNKRVAFFGIGVKTADMNKLAALSNRQPMHLDGLRFSDLFQWLSTSLSAVAVSRPGDQVPLPPPDWTTV